MATLAVNDKLRIKSDEYQWIVQRYSGILKSGEESWKAVSYHTSLFQAMRSIQRRVLRESDCTTMDDLLETAKESHQSLVRTTEQARLIDETCDFEETA